MILADRPDKPSVPPIRNSATNEFTASVHIVIVPGTHGSDIISYNIEVDDGQGGAFVEL